MLPSSNSATRSQLLKSSSTQLLVDGAEAAEFLLREFYRVDVSKVLDPLDPKDFLVIVNRLGSAMRGVNRRAEAPALKAALDSLDVDWGNLNAGQVNAVIGAAKQSLTSVPTQTMPVFEGIWEASADRTVKGTRISSKRRFKLKVPVKLSAQDKRISKHISASQSNFITDEYGRRRNGFSRTARSVVRKGLDEGKSSRQISAELRRQITGKSLRRNQHYWDTVASSFVNRARTFGELSVFEDAGIERYVFEAVLDERTTDICRYMHGKSWTVASGLKQFKAVDGLKDPDAIKDSQPWAFTAKDDDGNPVLAYKKNGQRRHIAEIVSSGFGKKDSTGSYKNAVTDRTLQSNGISMPPLHGLCRSTIVPDIV